MDILVQTGYSDEQGIKADKKTLIQFLSEEWMAIYPYNVFYLIDLNQSVNKSSSLGYHLDEC